MIDTSVADDLMSVEEEMLAQKLSEEKDDDFLDEMRIITRDYVQQSIDNKLTSEMAQKAKDRFNELRDSLQDYLLKEYSSFEFMEKLYRQEYLVDD